MKLIKTAALAPSVVILEMSKHKLWKNTFLVSS